MRVLVTGGTGAVGPAVVDALLREKYLVRLLARTRVHRSDVEVFAGDLTDPGSLSRALDGMDAVIHLAGMLHQTRVTPAVRAAYQRVNVDGTASLIAEAAARRVSRVVFASTIAVYGYNRGHVLTEQTTLVPDTDYGRSKAEAESIVRSAGGTVLRFGAIYGPRVRGNYQRLVTSLQRGRFVPIGAGTNRRTIIYDQDAAAAIIAVLRSPQSRGETYNVAHPHTPQVREIVAAICSALGRKPPRLYLPEGIVRVPVAALGGFSRLTGVGSPLTPAMLDKYLEDVVVSSQKIRHELNFEAPHDLDSGWAATIAAMRLAGRP